MRKLIGEVAEIEIAITSLERLTDMKILKGYIDRHDDTTTMLAIINAADARDVKEIAENAEWRIYTGSGSGRKPRK